MNTYTVTTGNKIVATAVPMNSAVKLWLELAKTYRRDPDNNESYAEITLDDNGYEYADENIVWGCSLDDAQIIDQNGYHDKDYVYIRSRIAQATREYRDKYPEGRVAHNSI